MATEIEIKLFPKQAQACEMLANSGPIEVLGYGGAKGGGKSHLSRKWLFLRGMKYAGTKHLLIRESFPELERTHINNFRKEMPPSLYGYTERNHTFTLANGSTIECGYIERPEQVESIYWGAEYDSIVIDEAQNHAKTTMQLLRACLRTTNPSIHPKMLMTFNWGSIGFAWMKKMFWRKWMKGDQFSPEDDPWDNPAHWEVGEDPKQFAFLQAKVHDNPAIIENDPGYIERLRALPENMRKAYLEGDPDVFEGQFFPEFGAHLREDVFELYDQDLDGWLFGSLDSGTTHNTAFGLSWFSQPHHAKRFGTDYTMHRLLTYCNNGGTIDMHAREIFDTIESFPHTRGHFPKIIWYDYAMDTKVKMNEYTVQAPIDVYKQLFANGGKGSVQWIPANKNKINGCQQMHRIFTPNNNIPLFRYWTPYNSALEEAIAAATFDKTNKEIYKKQDGDDCVDECRYKTVAFFSYIDSLKRGAKTKSKMSGIRSRAEKYDWKSI